jgi:lipopolysaccharide export system permease protein
MAMANSLYVIPFSNQAFEMKLKAVGRDSLPAFLKEGSFIDVFPKMVFYFRSVDPANLSIEGIFVQDQRREELRTTIIAESGHIGFQRDTNQLILRIANGIITRVPDNLKDAQSITFSEYDLIISLNELFGGAEKGGKNKNYMTLGDLLREIRERGGASSIRYALALHERLALPLSCLLLGLVAAPLGAIFRHKGRMTGTALGLSIFIAYYVLFSAGNGMAKNGLIATSIGVWTPNVLTAVLAALLWKRAHQEKLSNLYVHLKTALIKRRNSRCAVANRDIQGR